MIDLFFVEIPLARLVSTVDDFRTMKVTPYINVEYIKKLRFRDLSLHIKSESLRVKGKENGRR